MNAGSTITSRDSHDVRHIAAARHARSGRPRWKNEATQPDAEEQRAATSAPADEELAARGTAARSSAAPTSAA